MSDPDQSRDRRPGDGGSPVVSALVLLAFYVVMYLSIAAVMRMLEPTNAAASTPAHPPDAAAACAPITDARYFVDVAERLMPTQRDA